MEDLTAWRSAESAPVTLAPPLVHCERRPCGDLLLASPRALGAFDRNLGAFLEHWGETAPERPFIRQRVGEWPGEARQWRWRTLSYGEALARARSIAQALLDRGCGQDDPILILSGNSIEHALLLLGALFAGVPVAPVAPAYSLLSHDFAKLRAIVELLAPAMVFAESGRRFERAFHAIGEHAARPVEFVVSGEAPASLSCTPFCALSGTTPTHAVATRARALGPDTIAKILFTSGSTGTPKGVPNTHRMMCANQQMMALTVPPDAAHPPVMVDWLPWSHTFGGNVCFNWVLRDGGVLHLDEGQPVPGAFEASIANLREVSPTHYFNVPTGYAMLADALERDPELRENFFRSLRLCYYGGSGLPQRTWDRLQTQAVAATGKKLVFTTGCGSTETGPIATFLHWPVSGPGIVGLPLPGVSVKLVPAGASYEMRLKGESVFKGYYRRPDLSRAAFDDEGFYRTGDAVRLVDREKPVSGLAFEGRLSEDFKLATGTFVQVGMVRLAVLSAVPLLRDAVLAGPDRPWLGLLAWLNEAACQEITGNPNADMASLIVDPRIVRALQTQLQAYNSNAGGSSQRICRVRLLESPPSIEAGEITEKGYLNQKAVLARRAGEAMSLYERQPIGGNSPVLSLIDESRDISIPQVS